MDEDWVQYDLLSMQELEEGYQSYLRDKASQPAPASAASRSGEGLRTALTRSRYFQSNPGYHVYFEHPHLRDVVQDVTRRAAESVRRNSIPHELHHGDSDDSDHDHGQDDEDEDGRSHAQSPRQRVVPPPLPARPVPPVAPAVMSTNNRFIQCSDHSGGARLVRRLDYGTRGHLC